MRPRSLGQGNDSTNIRQPRYNLPASLALVLADAAESLAWQKDANQEKLQLNTREMQMQFSNAQCACARHHKNFIDGAWEGTQGARTHDTVLCTSY